MRGAETTFTQTERTGGEIQKGVLGPVFTGYRLQTVDHEGSENRRRLTHCLPTSGTKVGIQGCHIMFCSSSGQEFVFRNKRKKTFELSEPTLFLQVGDSLFS